MSHRSRCPVVDYDHLQLVGLWIGEEVVTWKLYLGLAFIVPNLERVTIGCFEEVGGNGGGGGGGVIMVSMLFVVMVLIAELEVLFVGLFVEENWSRGAEGKDSFVKCDMTRNDDFVGVQVKAPVSMMIVSVPKKDRWCGTRGKFVRWKGVRVTKASKCANVGIRVLRPNTREEDGLERGENIL
ncbi:hypothetical protein Tco_1464625, partial [Tanacetum coccineum]